MKKFPIDVPYELEDELDEERKEEKMTKESTSNKLNWFLNCLLKEINYKKNLKVIAQNLYEMDQVKTINGIKTLKKEIVKFQIINKHADIHQAN